MYKQVGTQDHYYFGGTSIDGINLYSLVISDNELLTPLLIPEGDGDVDRSEFLGMYVNEFGISLCTSSYFSDTYETDLSGIIALVKFSSSVNMIDVTYKA